MTFNVMQWNGMNLTAAFLALIAGGACGAGHEVAGFGAVSLEFHGGRQRLHDGLHRRVSIQFTGVN
jgi:hypothetical protein